MKRADFGGPIGMGTPSRAKKWLFAALGVCCVIAVWFLAQCVSHAQGPIVMKYDAGDYLQMADAIDAGQPINRAERPPGYSYLLVVLRRLGLGGNRGIVGLNVLLLAAGLAGFVVLARREFQLDMVAVACLTAWTLCSYSILDVVIVPQPEVAFFAATMGSLLCLLLSRNSPRPLLWVVASALLAAGAVMLRTIGIAMVPAIVWSARERLSRGSMTVLACCGLAALVAATRTDYFHTAAFSAKTSGPSFI